MNTENSIGTQDRLEQALAAPVLNPADYAEELKGLDLTDRQAGEILEILWSMMGFFARTGFEVDVCGLIFQDFNEASTSRSGDGKLDHSINQEKPSNGSGKERAT